jgi:hypothetical protein
MMQSQIETLDAAASTLTLSLDTSLYPRDVLYAAAYVFLDRAYVLLDRDGPRADSPYKLHGSGLRFVPQPIPGRYWRVASAAPGHVRPSDALQRLSSERRGQ